MYWAWRRFWHPYIQNIPPRKVDIRSHPCLINYRVCVRNFPRPRPHDLHFKFMKWGGGRGGILKCRLKKSVLILFQILTFFSENLGFFSLVYIQLILLIFGKSHQFFYITKLKLKNQTIAPSSERTEFHQSHFAVLLLDYVEKTYTNSSFICH